MSPIRKKSEKVLGLPCNLTDSLDLFSSCSSTVTLPTFDMARQRGTAGKIGQLNPTGRYGVAEEVSPVAFPSRTTDLKYCSFLSF